MSSVKELSLTKKTQRHRISLPAGSYIHKMIIPQTILRICSLITWIYAYLWYRRLQYYAFEYQCRRRVYTQHIERFSTISWYLPEMVVDKRNLDRGRKFGMYAKWWISPSTMLTVQHKISCISEWNKNLKYLQTNCMWWRNQLHGILKNNNKNNQCPWLRRG